jgi:uncharacterized membrane protein YsdA (DUF1294 family)
LESLGESSTWATITFNFLLINLAIFLIYLFVHIGAAETKFKINGKTILFPETLYSPVYLSQSPPLHTSTHTTKSRDLPNTNQWCVPTTHFWGSRLNN